MTAMLWILIALQVADAVTTYAGIKGGAHEANKLLRWLDTFLRRFTNAKWAWLVVSKGIGGAACVILVNQNQVEISVLVLLGYCYLIFNNCRELRRIYGKD